MSRVLAAIAEVLGEGTTPVAAPFVAQRHLGGGLWVTHDGQVITLQSGIDTIVIGPHTWATLAGFAAGCWTGERP